MRIALAQQNYHIGNFKANTAKIIAAVKKAKEEGAELIVFSELAICGYPPRDFLEFNDFLQACEHAVEQIKAEADSIGVLVGAPVRNEHREGKDLYNAVFFLYENEIKAIVKKTLLPTYDVFDEYRYFEPADEWNVVSFKGKKLAVTICEDIWNMGDNPLYKITPMERLMVQQPDIMINLSASPYNYAQDDVRHSLVKAHVKKYGLPMLYCNTVGSQTEIVFDGGSLVYTATGALHLEMSYFKEDFKIIDTADLADDDKKAQEEVAATVYYTATDVRGNEPTISYLTADKNIAEIYEALKLGIKDYFDKMGFKQAILGSSGGIDSAVTLALATEAIGADNVRAVLMPSQFSTDHSVADAVQLSEALGNPYDVVPIKPLYDAFIHSLYQIFAGTLFNVAEENIQSRSRGNVLMAIANKFNYILLNTSNKSELATGYGTLYGDMAGGISVLGDVYKSQVFALARYINRNGEIIPENIIVKPPSAELRPDQKDSDSLPEYEILDTVLYEYIERRKGPREIIEMGYDAALVDRILKMVNRNEYKRNQFCPIIRVSSKAFGMGRRLPIVASYLG